MNRDLLKAALFTPGPKGWGLPILFWGPPGTGKSDQVEDLVRQYAMHCEVLSPGERGEGGFGVTPVPVKASGGGYIISYPAPDWTALFEDCDDRGAVFVDELTTAPPALQPALLGLVHARRIGSKYLGRGIRVFGAANPTQQAAGGWDLAPPLANRFGHFEWEPPSSMEWGDWLLTAGQAGQTAQPKLDPAVEEKRVMGVWGSAYAKAKGIARAFVLAKPALLHAMPHEGDPQGSRAWPSHRTWDMGVRALASAEVHGLSEADTDSFVAGFIGGAAMTEFAAFRSANDLPDPSELLDGNVAWKHDGRRLDRTMAVISSCVALVSPTNCKSRDARADKLWSILHGVANDSPDLVVPAVRPLSQARLTTSKAALPVLTKLRPVLDAAGIKLGTP